MMGRSPRCYILSFVKIGPPVPEKIFEGFCTIYGRGTKFISFQCRECWNGLFNTKFEEPTSNTDISGKTKNDKTL